MAPYVLPDLPYDYGSLAPSISAEQLELHHAKHHAAYVKKANELVEQLPGADATTMPALARSFAFNLAGHELHSLFWKSLTPGGSAPQGAFLQAIEEGFGGVDQMTARLGDAVTSLMGSGWAVLAWEPIARRLLVGQLHDHQDNVPGAAVPLLVVDGWEHAFYVDHRNDKAGWVDSVTGVLDLAGAGRRFDAVASAPASA